MSVSVMITLFESIVKSILLYGSELWGIMGWRTNKLFVLKIISCPRKMYLKQFHGRFCKHVLGVHRQTPDILAKAEHGSCPQMGTIIKYIYNFWQHIREANYDSLTYKGV